jgi:hypothetical protein
VKGEDEMTKGIFEKAVDFESLILGYEKDEQTYLTENFVKLPEQVSIQRKIELEKMVNEGHPELNITVYLLNHLSDDELTLCLEIKEDYYFITYNLSRLENEQIVIRNFYQSDEVNIMIAVLEPSVYLENLSDTFYKKIKECDDYRLHFITGNIKVH